MKSISKYLGGFGSIFLLFGILAFLFFSDHFRIVALIQSAVGLLFVLIFLFYFAGDTLKTLSAKRDSLIGAIGGLFILAILVGLNVIAQSQWGERKWDTTINRVHSLAPESIAVVESMGHPVEVIAFMEKGNRSLEVLKGLIEKYSLINGKISLAHLEPNENPGALKDYEAQNGEVLLELKDPSLPQRKTLKLLTSRDVPTEEVVTNGLKRLVQTSAKKIYFLQGNGQSSLDEAEDEQGVYLARSRLEAEGFKVEPLVLAQAQSIPSDASVIVSWGAQRPMSSQALPLLTQFVSEGGKLVIALDPILSRDQLLATGYEPLLEKFGIRLEKAVAIEVLNLFGRPSPSPTILAFNYSDHPIVEKLNNQVTQFSLSSPLVSIQEAARKDLADLKVNHLVKTTANSWGEANIAALLNRQQASAKKDGNDIPGPFAIGMIAEFQPKEGKISKEGKLVVFGSSSFAWNGSLNSEYNRDLFLNTFGYLAGSENTSLTIRPRSWSASTLSMSPQQRLGVVYGSLFVIPQLLLILSVAVWIMRKRSV